MGGYELKIKQENKSARVELSTVLMEMFLCYKKKISDCFN